MKTKGLGWVPDLPDARDRLLAIPRVAFLPQVVDLRESCPPVYDQGQLGSCTAFAISGAIEFQHMAQGKGDLHLSELFVYYQERFLEHTISQDSGASIRDGMKVVNRYGAPAESVWPYDIALYMHKPPKPAYKSALAERTVRYARVPQNALKPVISQRMPVIFGFSVYDSFMTADVAETGIAPMPNLASERVVGGHAVIAVGYTSDTYICRNSWSAQWGQAGYFTIPGAYIEDPNMADDFWSISLVL